MVVYRTALHWAAKRNHEKVVRILLQEGADPTTCNSNGETPARMSNDRVIVSLLGGTFHFFMWSQFKFVISSFAKKVLAIGNSTENRESETKPAVNFVPNYLANPVFPYAEKKPTQRPRSESTNSLIPVERIKTNAPDGDSGGRPIYDEYRYLLVK